MGSVDLTPGAIAAVVGGGAEGTKPVVQALGLRLLDAAAAQRQQSSTVRRYSLCISDGTHLLQAIAAPKLNGLIKDGFLRSGSVVQLKDFIVEVTQGRRLKFMLFGISLLFFFLNQIFCSKQLRKLYVGCKISPIVIVRL